MPENIIIDTLLYQGNELESLSNPENVRFFIWKDPKNFLKKQLEKECKQNPPNT